jgi:hypothetical protein
LVRAALRFLIGNVLLYDASLLADTNGAVRDVFISLLYLVVSLQVFSLDAIIGPSRLRKGCLLGAVLMTLIAELVTAHSVDADGPQHPICFFVYCTTTASLRGSSMTTVAVFITKYLLHLVWRPRQLIILTSRIECDTVAQNPELEEERDAVPLSMTGGHSNSGTT